MGHIRILLIDQQPDSEKAALIKASDDLLLIAHTRPVENFSQLCDEYKPDLILIELPNAEMIDTIREMRLHCPDTKIVIFSPLKDPAVIRAAINAGVVGYLLEGSLQDDLVLSLLTAQAGKAVFSSEVTRLLLGD